MEAFIGLLGVLAAILAAWIGYSQGRAAERRDLFDRRLPVVREIEKALRVALNSGNPEERSEAFFDFFRAEMDAKYLFGPDVADTLESYRKDFAAINAFSNLPNDSPDRQNMIDEKHAAMQRIAAFLLNSSDLFAPYMRFGGSGGLARWVRERRGRPRQ